MAVGTVLALALRLGLVFERLSSASANYIYAVLFGSVLGIITAEATVSLLGLGVQAPGSSLGLMISDSAGLVYIQWTEVVWPTLTLALLVLSFSFIGDGVGDAFNPRTKD